jgi:hypothetical protein
LQGTAFRTGTFRQIQLSQRACFRFPINALGVLHGGLKSELKFARDVRDGKYRGKIIRPTLPILYELPREIAKDPEVWQDPVNWPMVMPNLGKSVHLDNLIADWHSEREKGDEAIKGWASQHLNIEIGIGINDDGWRGADGHYYYTFNPPASIVQGASLSAETYRDDEIWHLRGNPLTEDGLLGEPIWKSAREVFGRAVAVHEYGDIWFANSGQTGGIIKHPGNFKDKADKRTFLDNWRDAATGRNRHRDRLLTHGADYLALKVTNAEAQLLETEKQSDVEVFGLWSFPPHRAGRLDRATFSNIEQQSLDFVVLV